MSDRAGNGPALTYCLNVHPGERWEQQWAAIHEHALRIGARVAPGEPFPLGLRLSARSALELAEDADLRRAVATSLQEQGAYVMTVNAFPYGTFHGTRVKDRVYEPDWSDDRRVEYTLTVARVVAELAPEGALVSISTSPLSFKGWADCSVRAETGLRRLLQVGLALERLHRETGREVVLGMEPEPFCYPETTEEAVAVMQALRAQGRVEGVDPALLDRVCGRYVGLCFDTAHQAVEFEALDVGLRRLTAAGIRVVKVQLSAAIEADSETGRAELAAFAEPTYLHQVGIRAADGAVTRYADLQEALDSEPWQPGAVWRVHYHVPLFVGGFGELRSTQSQLTAPAFRQAMAESGVEHLEIETYTWDVWQRDAGQSGSVDEGIVREFEWVRGNVVGGR